MTLNDLKEEISALGFESEISLDKSFIIAVRRALATVYTERGVYKSIFIEHRPTRPTLIFEQLTHKASERELFSLPGRAYSLTVSGMGSFILTDNGVKTEYKFDTPTHIFRGFINSGAEIEFVGSTEFSVINLAVYENVRSDKEDDIHIYSHPYEYRMSELASDFQSFAALPTDRQNKEINGSYLSGELVILPEEYCGRVNLMYKCAPPSVSLDFPERQLDIPKDMEHVIALLSAAYFWLDDDKERSEFYIALYKDALSSARKNDTRRLGGGYRDVTGWA